MTGFDARAAAAAISRYRRSHGLSPVALDPGLTAAAQEKARHMAAGGGLNHSGFERRITGTGFLNARENIGAGSPTFDHVFAGWKASPPHHANLLVPGATHVGIAVADGPRTTYKRFWVMIVGTRATATQPSLEEMLRNRQ